MRTHRSHRSLLALLLFLLMASGAASTLHAELETAQEDLTVYVTATGDRYHRDGCRYLRRSRIPMPLTEAAREYSACRVCKPPQLGNAASPEATAPDDTGSPRSLLGWSQDEVKEALGTPAIVQGATWIFLTSEGRLRLEFDDDVVSAMQPSDFDVDAVATPDPVPAPPTRVLRFPSQSESERPPTRETPTASEREPTGRTYVNVDGERVQSPRRAPTRPPAATARCRDGTYSFSRNRRGTCSGHGGVATWF